MKALRQLCVASVFTLTLALTTFAGEIQTTVTSQPKPPTQMVTANGEIQTTVAGQEEAGSSEATATDSVTEAVLNLLQSVLSLF